MRNLRFIFLLSFLIIFPVNAQGVKNQQNPLSEARFNYFKKTIIVFNEYLDTDNGSFNTTDFRISLPVGDKSWNLRADLPLISTNTPSINKTGMGDISVAVAYIPYLKDNQGIALRAKITSNSANNPSFGTGKWVFAPTLFFGQYLGNNHYLWLAYIENQFSFAGSSERSKINATTFDNTLLYFFDKNWLGANVSFRYNSILDATQNSAFIEYGRKITPDSMFYIHPSIGFGSKKSYNYGIELGLVIHY